MPLPFNRPNDPIFGRDGGRLNGAQAEARLQQLVTR